jgi:UDP:flavonoid glycosyltransferase YjiC (YdhE family)
VLSRAVASRSWCRAVWIRRGMWAPGYDPSLQRSGNYDLIIEPGDLAASRDGGATASRREETLGVDPITLLDARELLSRAEAAKTIGFDPSRPAVLLQIGSGENRDILGLIDQALRACRRYPDLQVAVAEWANSSGALDLWPGITVLKGMPLSQYFHAFDFTISAAGYNSFHEIINFGLPSILVPNQAPRMDDQAGRSAYAQDEGAAIELKEHEFAELPAILDLFMRPEFRTVMQENCRKLARSNGARTASRMIAELVS